MFVYVASRGAWNSIKEGHDRVFLLAWLSFMVVGIGSFLFHSTLWYSMQLLDELSMITTTLVMWFATFAYNRSPLFSWFLGIILVGTFTLVASVYHYLGDPAFHQNVYGILTLIVLMRSWHLVHTQVRKASPTDYWDMAKLVGMGLGCLTVAFTLWTGDNEWCGSLRGWRRGLGLPWGLLLEGHGYWHLLSGLGGYFYITYGIYLRYCLEKRQDEYELVWPSTFFSLPYVRKRRQPPSLPKKVMNGSSKKEL